MKNIENSIYENQDKIIEVIRKGIQIPSVKGEPQENAPYGENVKRMLEFALELGESWGLKTKNVDGRAGWVEIGEGDSRTSYQKGMAGSMSRMVRKYMMKSFLDEGLQMIKDLL